MTLILDCLFAIQCSSIFKKRIYVFYLQYCSHRKRLQMFFILRIHVQVVLNCYALKFVCPIIRAPLYLTEPTTIVRASQNAFVITIKHVYGASYTIIHLLWRISRVQSMHRINTEIVFEVIEARKCGIKKEKIYILIWTYRDSYFKIQHTRQFKLHCNSNYSIALGRKKNIRPNGDFTNITNDHPYAVNNIYNIKTAII